MKTRTMLILMTLAGSTLADEPTPATPPATTPVPQTAPTPITPTAAGPSSTTSTMRDLVAQAIRRKLEQKNFVNAANPQPPDEAFAVQAETLESETPPPAKVSTIKNTTTLPEGAALPTARAGDRVFMGASKNTQETTTKIESAIEPDQTAWLLSARPGSDHDLLDMLVGTWTIQATFDNGPDQPADTGTGTMVNTWKLDGRYLQQDYTGDVASLGKITGIGFLGFDNAKKRYTSTWMDTLSTTTTVAVGTFNPRGASFSFTSTITAPPTSEGEKPMELTQKQVLQVRSPDRYVVTMYLAGPDGSEFKTGELVYTRATSALAR